MHSLTIAIDVTYKAIRWMVSLVLVSLVSYLKIVTGMAGALSDYSRRRHLQGHTMDGQSRIGGSYLKIVTGD